MFFCLAGEASDAANVQSARETCVRVWLREKAILVVPLAYGDRTPEGLRVRYENEGADEARIAVRR